MRDEHSAALRRAAETLAVGHELMMSMPALEAAEAAHYAGGPSVDELERRIREYRGE